MRANRHQPGCTHTPGGALMHASIRDGYGQQPCVPSRSLTLSQAAAHSPAVPDAHFSSAVLMAVSTAALSCVSDRGGMGDAVLQCRTAAACAPHAARILGHETKLMLWHQLQLRHNIPLHGVCLALSRCRCHGCTSHGIAAAPHASLTGVERIATRSAGRGAATRGADTRAADTAGRSVGRETRAIVSGLLCELTYMC